MLYGKEGWSVLATLREFWMRTKTLKLPPLDHTDRVFGAVGICDTLRVPIKMGRVVLYDVFMRRLLLVPVGDYLLPG